MDEDLGQVGIDSKGREGVYAKRSVEYVDCVPVPDDQGGFQAEGAERLILGAKQTILYFSCFGLHFAVANDIGTPLEWKFSIQTTVARGYLSISPM